MENAKKALAREPKRSWRLADPLQDERLQVVELELQDFGADVHEPVHPARVLS